MKNILGDILRYVVMLALCQVLYNFYGFETTIITLLVFILLSVEEQNKKVK